MTGELPLAAWLLGAAVAAWVAGFDLFYAISDIEIDRAQGLHSFPARFGVGAAFWGARVLHVATLLLLAWAGADLDAGVFYWLGVGVVAALLAYEHAIVSPGDLRRLNTAFFTLNGVISIVFFGFVLLDVAT
jgi:4-hydroxybenzoate polyprenyltransferase